MLPVMTRRALPAYSKQLYPCTVSLYGRIVQQVRIVMLHITYMYLFVVKKVRTT